MVPEPDEGSGNPGIRSARITAGVTLLLISVCAALSLAGCGSGRTSTVRQAADPSGRLRFVKSSLSARAGRIKLVFTDASNVPHNLTIQRGTDGPVLASTSVFKHGQMSMTVTLKPGRYTFYCDVPGHRAAGMHGILTVR